MTKEERDAAILAALDRILGVSIELGDAVRMAIVALNTPDDEPTEVQAPLLRADRARGETALHNLEDMPITMSQALNELHQLGIIPEPYPQEGSSAR